MGTHARHNVILTAAIAGLGGLLFGYDTGIIASAMLFIRSDFDLDSFQQGLVVAAVPIGAAFGALGAGPMADTYGRRIVIIASAFVFIAGALGSAASDGVGLLTVSRIVIGVAIGFASATAPVYISEIAPPEMRGRLVTLFQLSVTVGILVAYLVGLAFEPSGDWRWMLGLGAVPALLLAVGMLRMPQSPRWLVMSGRSSRPARPCSRSAPGARTMSTSSSSEIESARRPGARRLARAAHTADEGGADGRRRPRDPAADHRHQHGHLLRADDHRVHRHRLVLRGDPRLDRRRHRQRRHDDRRDPPARPRRPRPLLLSASPAWP